MSSGCADDGGPLTSHLPPSQRISARENRLVAPDVTRITGPPKVMRFAFSFSIDVASTLKNGFSMHSIVVWANSTCLPIPISLVLENTSSRCVSPRPVSKDSSTCRRRTVGSIPTWKNPRLANPCSIFPTRRRITSFVKFGRRRDVANAGSGRSAAIEAPMAANNANKAVSWLWITIVYGPRRESGSGGARSARIRRVRSARPESDRPLSPG